MQHFSLLGVSGLNFNISVTINDWGNGHPITRNELALPEVGIVSGEADLFEALRPTFDVMWSAAGWPRSMSYDNHGARVGWFNLNRDGSSRLRT